MKILSVYQFNPCVEATDGSALSKDFVPPRHTFELVQEDREQVETTDVAFPAARAAIRCTSYDEIGRVLNISGCSPKPPYWVNSVMGAIDMDQGVLFVNPNDWVVELLPNKFLVLSTEEYDAFLKEGLNDA